MSIASIRQQTAQRMDGHFCTLCGSPTTYETMSNCGARCFPCFANYCRSVPYADPVMPLPEAEASSPKAWAYRLKRREQAGETISPLQRSAWREGLRMHMEQGE